MEAGSTFSVRLAPRCGTTRVAGSLLESSSSSSSSKGALDFP